MVDEASWERHGALSGVGFVVLLVIAVALAGTGTQPSDSADEVRRYYADNQDMLRVSAYLGGLATIPFLWFLGSLARALRPASARLATTATASGVAATAFFGAGLAVSAALALSVNRQVDATTIEFLGALIASLISYASFAAASLTLAVGVVALRYRVLPAWLAWLSLLATATGLVGALQIARESDGLAAFGFVALGVFLAWVLALAITLYRQGDTAPGRT